MASALGETKPGAKDAVRRAPADAMLTCAMSWETNYSHGFRTGIAVTAAKDRSVWTPRPPVG